MSVRRKRGKRITDELAKTMYEYYKDDHSLLQTADHFDICVTQSLHSAFKKRGFEMRPKHQHIKRGGDE